MDSLFTLDIAWPWPLAFFAYMALGWILTRPQGPVVSQLMTVIGWPIDLTQRLCGLSALPYIFIFPNILIFILFTFAPLFINMGLSVTEGQSIHLSDRPYIADENFVRLLGEVNPDTGHENLEDEKFFRAITQTFLFTCFQVPIMVILALCTALVLNRDVKGRGFWRAVFFYPVMLSPVVVGFLWSLILKRQGVLSSILIQIGILDAPIQWLQDPHWTMFWSIFVYTWAHLGFYMLILLAALQAIPGDVYEAADMDGTSPFRQFTRITLPLLKPTLLIVTLLSVIKAIQAFEELYALNVRWQSIIDYIFEVSGLRGQLTMHGLGIAAAASVLLSSVFIALSVLHIYHSRRAAR